MITKTIRYTVTADLIGWECYYALCDQIGEIPKKGNTKEC